MQLPLATILFMFASFISRPAADDFERCNQNFEHECYYVLNKKYPGIEEFEFFWVEELDRANFLFRGAAYINKTFHKFEGTVERNRIFFAVSSQGGIEYKFEGAFLPSGRRVGKKRIAIDGRLTKRNENKKEKVRNVKLFVDFGGNQ